MVDDDVGDQSPFFPAESDRLGRNEASGDSLAGSDDSTPRPYLTLEERMAARGWRWSGNQLKHHNADEDIHSGQPCLDHRAPSDSTATTDSLVCAEPVGPPPPLRSSQCVFLGDTKGLGEAEDSEDSYGDMYANAGAGIEGASSSDDDT